MIQLITNYIIDDNVLQYDDGNRHFEARYYICIERKEFRIYDIPRECLSDNEIGIILNEFLTYYYYIIFNYLPEDCSLKELYVESFSLLINGYNVSNKGYDILTYYITQISAPKSESKELKKIREAFEYIIENTEKLGKEAIIIPFKGSIFAFSNFYIDLLHVIDNYEEFPEEIYVIFDFKKGIFNHKLYILPSEE